MLEKEWTNILHLWAGVKLAYRTQFYFQIQTALVPGVENFS